MALWYNASVTLRTLSLPNLLLRLARFYLAAGIVAALLLTTQPSDSIQSSLVIGAVASICGVWAYYATRDDEHASPVKHTSIASSFVFPEVPNAPASSQLVTATVTNPEMTDEGVRDEARLSYHFEVISREGIEFRVFQIHGALYPESVHDVELPLSGAVHSRGVVVLDFKHVSRIDAPALHHLFFTARTLDYDVAMIRVVIQPIQSELFKSAMPERMPLFHSLEAALSRGGSLGLNAS